MEDHERMEKRERDKKERAKQSQIQNTEPPEPLFNAPTRVSSRDHIASNVQVMMFELRKIIERKFPRRDSMMFVYLKW